MINFIGKALLLLFISGTSVFVAAEDLDLQEYCMCRGTLSLESNEVRFTPGSDPKSNFEACQKQFNSLYEEPSYYTVGEDLDSKFEPVTRKGDNDLQGHICNPSERKATLATYKNLQKKSEDLLEEQVEIEICDSYTTHKGKRAKVSVCREALVDLLSEHEKVIYDQCQEDFRNRGKNKQVNRCIRIESYKLLLNNNDGKFFLDICPKDSEASFKQCVHDIRTKLGNFYYQDEVALCVEPNGFNTEKSEGVCKDVLLSKILAFSTNEERVSLLNCIKSVSGQQEIAACVSKLLNREDEKQMLEQLKDKFCSDEEFPNPDKQKQCLEDLLLENLQDMPLHAECKDLPDETSQKKCQRLKLYEDILEKNDQDVYDCWNREKFPSMKERATCHDISKKNQAEIQRCNTTPDPEARLQCLMSISGQGTLNGYDIVGEEISRAMDRALKELGIDTSSCSSSKDKKQCLEQLYEQYKAQQEGEQGLDGLTTALPGTDSSSGLGGSSPGSNGGLSNEAGSDSSAAKGDNITSSGKLKGGAVAGVGALALGAPVQSRGLKAMFKDLAYIKYLKKGSDPHCKALGKAALLRITGTIAGITAAVVAGKKAKDNAKKAEGGDVQKKSFSGTKEIFQAAAAGLGVKLLFNMAAQSVISQTMAQESLKVKSGNPTICGPTTAASPSSSYNHNPAKDHLFVSRIEKATSYQEVMSIQEEWDSYILGQNWQPQNENQQIEMEQGHLAVLKQTLISFMGYSSNLLVGNAVAADDIFGKININTLMTLASFATQLKGSAGKETKQTDEKLEKATEGGDVATLATDYTSTNTRDSSETQQVITETNLKITELQKVQNSITNEVSREEKAEKSDSEK